MYDCAFFNHMRRHNRVFAVNFPALVIKVKGGVLGKKIHVCFPKAFYRAHVLPIALKAVGAKPLACF